MHAEPGTGIPTGRKSLLENIWGQGESSLVTLHEDGDEDFLLRVNGYGGSTPDGEFPIAISSCTWL
jgi:hypothetical protein